ncbi:M3 family oligoendopeptidase [Candidatus Methylacidiphilum infernorum]|uniref:M3 family oligoendopeptidase n=2 Tax=Candidatus Methylacidiphilum infernorum TaxID=511746 RepID=A0ABX7PWR0_9BACT|nr:M3 family oligoendopeptidase [Candidatus Methylacidiphilum infernorum]
MNMNEKSEISFSFSPYKPLQFLEPGKDILEEDTLCALFDRLEQELQNVRGLEDLKRWIGFYDELREALDEERTKRYIAMTCQTDDEEREKSYLYIVTVVEPLRKPRQMALLQKLVSNPFFNSLDGSYAVFKRSVLSQLATYSQENIAREVEEEKLCQQYQKISGGLAAEYEGKEYTLVQLSPFLEDQDREKRKKVWEIIAQKRLEKKDIFEELFDKLLALRSQIAASAGFDNYRSYIFEKYRRFDYTPEDCLKLAEAIEQVVVPVQREIQDSRKRALGLDRLRPWDLAVDPEGKPPLKPFHTTEELFEKVGKIFKRMDLKLWNFYQTLGEKRLIDLENRKGKAPGGYQSTLPLARLPFIFMNAVGTHRDLETLLHESGHAIHSLASRDQFLYDYRSAPLEFCEVASMSMELFASSFLDEFYSDKELKRANRKLFEGIILFFPWMATVDSFQQKLYTSSDQSREKRADIWESLVDRFGGIVDWEGYEEARRYLWHSQLHIFEIPFYYIEYGIAQMGALAFWIEAKKDLKTTLERYLYVLSLGGSKPLRELFQLAGLPFDFSAQTLRPLIEAAREEWLRFST